MLRTTVPQVLSVKVHFSGACVPIVYVETLIIQKVLEATGGNVSESARLLNMHRRTLQRKRDAPIPKTIRSLMDDSVTIRVSTHPATKEQVAAVAFIAKTRKAGATK